MYKKYTRKIYIVYRFNYMTFTRRNLLAYYNSFQI